MRKRLRTVGSGLMAFVLLSAMSAGTKADVALTNVGTSAAALAAWSTTPGVPIYTSVATPVLAATAQGNVGAATGATFQAMAETFTPTTSFTLGALAISGSGGTAPFTIQMHLFDVTSKITSNNGTTTQGSGAVYSKANTPALTDLFGNGAGLTFSNPAQGQGQLLFSLTNGATNDRVSLTAGHIYALEFWTPVGTSGFTWWRAPAATAVDGEMMVATDAGNTGTGASTVNANFTAQDLRITLTSAGLAGGAPRTASLALYAVPEPGTLVLLGLGVSALMFAARRRLKASA